MAGLALGVGAAITRPALAASMPSGTASALRHARATLERLGDHIVHRDIVGVADFGIHSAKPRFHLIDMESGRITSFLVAHGKGSDPSHTGWLERFSNQAGSNATSAGAYVTGESYVGQHGASRRLHGLDPDNSLAYDRAIVVHGASYVGQGAIAAYGMIGRSLGCFAFAPEATGAILDRLGEGRLLLARKGPAAA